MSLFTMTEVRCDDCGETNHEPYGTGAMSRRVAREDGWRVSLPGGQDLCPDCRTTIGDAPDT